MASCSKNNHSSQPRTCPSMRSPEMVASGSTLAHLSPSLSPPPPLTLWTGKGRRGSITGKKRATHGTAPGGSCTSPNPAQPKLKEQPPRRPFPSKRQGNQSQSLKDFDRTPPPPLINTLLAYHTQCRVPRGGPLGKGGGVRPTHVEGRLS